MKVRYSRRALTQLDQILSYIAKDNPAVAIVVAHRIEALIALLGRYPMMGRPTDKENVRVMGVRRYRISFSTELFRSETKCVFCEFVTRRDGR